MVNAAVGRNNAHSERILRYRYRRDVTSKAMMKPAATGKIYDANFPPREFVREIHSRWQTFGARFSIGWHLSIIEILVFPPFSTVIGASPFRQSPFCCLPTSVNPPAFPASPKHVLPAPENASSQIKRRRLRSAYQCCFYRIGARQTSARSSFLFRPFFQTIVFHSWNRHRPYPCRRRRN